MVKLELTEKQAEVLRWAIYLTEASYEGWSKDEMGRETLSDLRVLSRVEEKLNK